MHTHRFATIFQAIDTLRAHGGIFLILAAPGTGKSHLLAAYTAARPDSDVAGPIFHLRTDVVNTPLSLVQHLLLHLDIGWHGPTRAGLAVLNTRLHGHPLLLVDDAHRLTASSLELLRTLYESNGFRLVLCGPPRLRSNLLRKCPELAHRVTRWAPLENLTLSDTKGLLAPPLYPLAPALHNATGGNAFWVTTVLDEARRVARYRHHTLVRTLHDTLQHRGEQTA